MNSEIQDKDDQFRALYKKVKTTRAKAEDIRALQKIINDDPCFCAALVPLMNSTVSFIIKKVTSTPASQEAIRANLLAVRNDLGFATAPPIEKALIEHASLYWLRLQLMEEWYSERSMVGTHTVEAGLYFEKRLAAAQKRYIRAIETLAKVRRLTRGLTIVNVAAPGGQQQVNQVIQNT